MKNRVSLIIILIVLSLIYVTFSVKAQEETEIRQNNEETAPLPEQTKVIDVYDEERLEPDDDNFFFYSSDILSKKLFQEKLPPLTKKEKIIWSFRMAKKNAYL